MKKPWDFVKADKFFAVYCPKIKNYKQKISGKNTRGNPLDFSDQEKREIKAALKKLLKDIAI